MERLLGGLLAAVGLMLLVASPASAAPIPPTDACEVTFHQLFDAYAEEITPRSSDKETKAADRELAEGLVAGGCVTSAEPLYKELRSKPFTAKCLTASAEAQKYWGPTTRTLNSLYKAFFKVAKPNKRRFRVLTRKIHKLKKNGKDRQAASLERKRERVRQKLTANAKIFGPKIKPLIFGDAYKNFLVVAELISLRCISGDAVIFTGDAKGPAADVLNKNATLVFTSIMFLAFRDASDTNGLQRRATAELPVIGSQDLVGSPQLLTE